MFLWRDSRTLASQDDRTAMSTPAGTLGQGLTPESQAWGHEGGSRGEG